jgi:predicted amidophosphoribosyltransferase
MLRRVTHARAQKTLDARARRDSPHGDFRVSDRPPPTTGVVLVDDVRTTGATARAAAEALRTAGAPRVLVVTLAAALRQGGRT